MPDFTLYQYLERVANTSPATAGFSITGGQATVPYLVDPSSTSLAEAIPEILGSVGTHDDGSDHFGKLSRVLPKAHPAYPWMFCDRIESIIGLGGWEINESAEVYEADTLISGYAAYELLQLNLGFTPRPYAVLSDDSINTREITYYPPEGDDVETGIAVPVADEYYRFTDYEILPGVEIASAQHGQMKLRSTDDSLPGNAKTASGFPRITIQKSMIKFTWYQVPFGLVEHPWSWIDRGVGMINQNDWYGWSAGSLLYLGVDIRRYTPPVPERSLWQGTTSFSSDKMCDITFSFEYTRRTASGTPPTPARPNWLAAGHNLMPNIAGNRAFYYATAVSGANPDVNTDTWYPTYLSFPFEFLFTDPSALGELP